MSSSSGNWPVVPGMAYIVKLGDFTHVLQAADQLSSQHLNLAQLAVRNIDLARNLLIERGPFLLLERQLKMDEVITDTEEAIDRVIRLIEPSRVDKITRDTINIPDLWALRDEHKSAATFGRLRITHDRLKTVIHDLQNIEATAQLDDCNTRATTNVDETRRRESASDIVPIASPIDARNLITWKRSRRSHRHSHNNNSNVSSVSGMTTDDRDLNELASPVSLHRRSLGLPNDTPAGAQHEPGLTSASLLHPDFVPDHASEISADRLPVIPELEGGTVIQLGPVRPAAETSDQDKETGPGVGASTTIDTPVPFAEGTALMHAQNEESRSQENPPASTPTRAPSVTTSKANPRMQRETFDDMRRRHARESKQTMANGATPPQQKPPGMQPGVPINGRYFDGHQPQLPGRFHPLNVRSPAYQIASSHEPRRPDGIVPSKGLSQSADAHVSQGAANDRSTVAANMNSARPMTQTDEQARAETGMKPELSVRAGKSATYPTVQTQLSHPQGLSPAVGEGANRTNGDPPNQILSPSRTQASPQEQIQSPQTLQPDDSASRRPHLRDHQVMSIDPKLMRLPSILQAARSKRPRASVAPPYPVSDTSSDERNELHLPGDSQTSPTEDFLYRPITAPPSSGPVGENTLSLSRDLATREDLSHQRSMSDTIVPQINVTRAPTVPRKPLPYRGAPLPSREPSPADISRSNTPGRMRPESMFIQSQSDLHQLSRPVSGLPSPIPSEHDGSSVQARSRGNSMHSLQVQASSSSDNSSRRSSVSAEDTAVGSLPVQNRPPVINPLAMNPPMVTERQQSDYRSQVNIQPNPPAPVQVSQPDYRSPAFQQSRQFTDPGYNVYIGQISPSAAQSAPRFRDQDQSKSIPNNPLRSRTEPVLIPSSNGSNSELTKPRRSSEQGKTSFLRHQTAAMLARAQQAPKFQLPHAIGEQVTSPRGQPAPTPQPAARTSVEQQAAPRLVLTPQHPPSMTNSTSATNGSYSARIIQAVSGGRGAPPDQQANQQVAKDRDLFGQQMFRPATDKQPQPSAGPSTAASPERQHTQENPSKQPYDCRCEEEASPVVTSSGRTNGMIPEQSQDSSKLKPLENDNSMGPSRRPRKRSSWLIHQASRLSGQRH